MNQDGDTALSRAARKKNAGMVTLLLDRGATIDHTDKVERLPVRYKLWGICFWEYRIFEEPMIRKDN